MSDYIEREAVMDVFMRFRIGWGSAKVKGVINSIPAADVRPVVRGKWEMNSNYPDRFICSECGAQFDCWHWEAKQMHYCPSCWAKMDGGQDDV